ncbi:bifunctional molybdenum cofactor biosynthesis protein MoaC/MoaB [Cytophagaceae bacterium ABcell3]|nr:bifunctional molybdenum cofactor biosynthesis protein MoaC/MoaB [Cytophagaceae bacterium ABcell3]
MVDITEKSTTLRHAIAQAIVKTSKQETIDAIKNGLVPKGNVFEIARAAGLFAVKRTSDTIPDCHPLPIEYTHISYEIKGLDIFIYIEVKTIYKTGVEVEAMHGASVVALTMYDMLKPIDKGIEIANIKLLEKKGGKSDHKAAKPGTTAEVIVCSDSIASGKKEDRAGSIVKSKLASYNLEISGYTIIPDNQELLKEKIVSASQSANLIIICGGTGLTKKDNTPEVLKPLLETEIPGIMEAARSYGQQRTPAAMFSRGVAGLMGKTLVMAIPGSTKGAEETINALFPGVLHILNNLQKQ